MADLKVQREFINIWPRQKEENKELHVFAKD